MRKARKITSGMLLLALLLTCFAVPQASAAVLEPVVIDTSSSFTKDGTADLDSTLGAFVLPLPTFTGMVEDPEDPEEQIPAYDVNGSITFTDVNFGDGAYNAFTMEFVGSENFLHLEVLDDEGGVISEALYKTPGGCDAEDASSPYILNLPLTAAVSGVRDVRVSAAQNPVLTGENAADAKTLWLKKLTFVDSKDATQRLHFMWSGRIVNAYKMANGEQTVEGFTHNSTLTYSGLNFGDAGYNQLLLRARGNGGVVTVYLDSMETDPIAALTFATGWYTAELTSPVFDEITGTHDLIFAFSREGAEDGQDAYVNLYDFQFIEADITDGHSEFNATSTGDALGWFGNGSTVTYNNIRFDEAVSMTFKMSDSNSRNLTLQIHLNSADGTVIGEAVNLVPDKIEGGYRYYTVYFDEAISGVYHIVLTTTADVWNENLYTMVLNQAAAAERDGHEWITATDFGGYNGSIAIDTENGKISSFEGAGKSVVYNNVEFKGAEALILKTSKHMNRSLTMNVYLNSTGGKLVGSAARLGRYMVEPTDSGERYAYFAIFFDEAITGVYNLVLTTDNIQEVTGDTNNEHLYGLKLVDSTEKATIILDGHAGFPAGTPAETIGGATTGDKLGYFGGNAGAIYGNVDFGASADGLQFELDRFTDRTLTVTVRLNSSDGDIIGEATAAEPDRTNANGLDYYTVWFNEPVSGIHNLVIVSGTDNNANVVTLKLVDKAALGIGTVAEADGVYTLEVTQNKETAETVVLIVAKYDADGRLTGIDMDDFAPGADKIGTTETLSVPMAKGENETVKTFVWNSLSGMMPV